MSPSYLGSELQQEFGATAMFSGFSSKRRDGEQIIPKKEH
jgi:hypothetical protein